MNTTPDLETILKYAPCPEPPTDLLATLERQIQLPSIDRREEPVSFWRQWRALWMPLAGLAGMVALVLVISLALWSSTARTLADSFRALARVKSCRVVERFRKGPDRPVIIDKTKPPGAYPNYFTEDHPDNPLVEEDHWFRVDPADPSLAQLRTWTPDKDIWQQGNLVLTVVRRTGARSLRVVNAPNGLMATLQPLAGLTSLPMTQVKPQAAQATTLDRTTGLLEGEIRVPDPSMPGAKMILRFWANPTTQLPVRLQFWSAGFPQVAPEVLMEEYDFSDFDAVFPEKTFKMEVTDADLAALGTTRAQLAAMGSHAVSFDVTGEAGAKVAGTVRDDAGIQQVQGTLPFTFLHEQHGNLEFDLEMVDGKKRAFGIHFNNTHFRADLTSHIKGKRSANGTSESVWNVN